LVGAVGIAIGVGRLLGARLPERFIRFGAAAAFAIFGVLLLYDAFA
jgi:putative Ca2+/H+ antiporter (TMEM165/GDT1 family)